ncbi:hypothetical protein JXQ31_10100 [candidate division KSB1 bacterium]|nr:hypothetical protein [candidate division KSB1 bacterium]
MKLPNKEQAIIPASKIKDYLLSNSHPTGRSKSNFFRMFGFDETNIDIFEQCLLKIAQTNNVTFKVTSYHGKKYIIDGKLSTPVGRDISIRTVWTIEKNGDNPRFVTAYPK